MNDLPTCPCCGAPPDLLTVAETMRVLRMGRTKTYELLSEWRDSSGRSGLRVLELGNALRVPRVALEDLIGGPVHVTPEPAVGPAADAAAPVLVAAGDDAPEPARPSRQRPARRPSRRPGTVPVRQLDLFDPPAES